MQKYNNAPKGMYHWSRKMYDMSNLLNCCKLQMVLKENFYGIFNEIPRRGLLLIDNPYGILRHNPYLAALRYSTGVMA